MSLLSSMNMAQQALLVNEAALSVVSNNISNIDTQGYSRQRVVLSPSVNYSSIGNSAMNQVRSSAGVELISVERYTDTYLEAYCRQQTSQNSYLGQYATVAANLEDIVNELKGTGLEATLSKFYEAAQNLSLYPSDASARTSYIQQAQSVAIQFNNISSLLSEERVSLVGDGTEGSLASSKISNLTAEVNSKLEQLVTINENMIKVGSRDLLPNSLLDQRDQILSELSEMIPITATESPNGAVSVSLNGLDLIRTTEFVGKLGVTIGTADNPATVQLLRPDGSVAIEKINEYVDSGSMGAILDVCGPAVTGTLTIDGILKDLDKMANGFAKIINDIQTLTTPDGKPMAIDKDSKKLIDSVENIFKSSDGGVITASNISINSAVINDPSLIAAARVNPADYQDTAIGNNSNMIKILASRTTSYEGLNNLTPEGYVAGLVSEVGIKVSTINEEYKSQSSVLSQVQTNLASSTGVNLNEELMDLTKYQTAYRASARLFSVCNELLDVLIGLGA